MWFVKVPVRRNGKIDDVYINLDKILYFHEIKTTEPRKRRKKQLDMFEEPETESGVETSVYFDAEYNWMQIALSPEQLKDKIRNESFGTHG